jgi:multiple sugar transport system permease protein
VNKGSKEAFWFLLPYFSLYVVFFLMPAVTIIPMSLTSWSIVGTPRLLWFDNFLALLQDPLFWKAVRNTFYYTALVTIVLTILGLLLALLLNQSLRGRLVGRAFVILPYVISSAAAGILWKWMFERNFGILNSYLRLLHLPTPGWLADVDLAIPSIVLVNSWWSVGFNTVIYLAALQGIPSELYEAAEVDGATPFQSFRFITLPMLRPITLYVTVLCAANSFQMFDEAYIMTQGGPIGATTTLVYKIYTSAFENFRFGYAAALSVITLAIILVITMSQFRLAGRRTFET